MIVFPEGEHSFWVNVSDPEDGVNSNEQILEAGYSAEFVALLALARRLKCNWLMLDRDGPVRDELPQFDW